MFFGLNLFSGQSSSLNIPTGHVIQLTRVALANPTAPRTHATLSISLTGMEKRDWIVLAHLDSDVHLFQCDLNIVLTEKCKLRVIGNATVSVTGSQLTLEDNDTTTSSDDFTTVSDWKRQKQQQGKKPFDAFIKNDHYDSSDSSDNSETISTDDSSSSFGQLQRGIAAKGIQSSDTNSSSSSSDDDDDMRVGASTVMEVQNDESDTSSSKEPSISSSSSSTEDKSDLKFAFNKNESTSEDEEVNPQRKSVGKVSHQLEEQNSTTSSPSQDEENEEDSAKGGESSMKRSRGSDEPQPQEQQQDEETKELTGKESRGSFNATREFHSRGNQRDNQRNPHRNEQNRRRRGGGSFRGIGKRPNASRGRGFAGRR